MAKLINQFCWAWFKIQVQTMSCVCALILKIQIFIHKGINYTLCHILNSAGCDMWFTNLIFCKHDLQVYNMHGF